MIASTTIITSRANPLIRKLAALNDARGIRKHGVCLAGGARLVREALRDRAELVEAVIAAADQPDLPAPPGVPRYMLAPGLLQSVNVFGAPGPLLLMRLPVLPAYDPAALWPDGCTLFAPFSDPENVGGVIRSAAALGAARVVLTAETACPFLPRALRASAGTVWQMPVFQAGPLEELTWPAGRRVFTLDAAGRPLDQWPAPRGSYGLLPGQEGPGLPAGLRGRLDCTAIPMRRGVESLNAATAVAIALWAWQRPDGQG